MIEGYFLIFVLFLSFLELGIINFLELIYIEYSFYDVGIYIVMIY